MKWTSDNRAGKKATKCLENLIMVSNAALRDNGMHKKASQSWLPWVNLFDYKRASTVQMIPHS